jgi:tetratricopeptide (TPR) repeat protein
MRRIGQVVLGLYCISFLSSTYSADALQGIESSLYQQGRAAFDKARFDESIAFMAKFEAANPGKSDALLYEAKALFNLDRFAEAEAALLSYSTANPESAEALFTLGAVQQHENKARESLQTYTAAARFRTPSSNDLKSVALDYVLLDDYPDAIQWLQKAVQIDPANADAWYSLGRCYYTQSRFSDAERAFNKSLALDPNRVKAAENLGLVLEAENNSVAADESFQRAVALARNQSRKDEWIYLDYASFLIDHDRSAEAVSLLRTAIGIAPKSAQCHEKLGRALAATGYPTQGIAELESAVALSPQDAHLHYELGLAYRHAGMLDRAKDEMAASEKLYGAKAAGERK